MDKTRPYTYPAFISDFKAVVALVEGHPDELPMMGPTGPWLQTYNLSKEGNGVDITVAHGGSAAESDSHNKSTGHSRVALAPPHGAK